jgi:hypothetical protein
MGCDILPLRASQRGGISSSGREFVLGLAFAYVCLDLWWTASVGNAMAGDSIEGPGPGCRTIREEALPTTH